MKLLNVKYISVLILLLLLGSCSDMGEPEVLLPLIEVDSTDIDFSTITIGSHQIQHIQILNGGEGDLNGELTLVQDHTAYVLEPEGAFLLLSGDTLILELTFTPDLEETYTGQVLIDSDDPLHPAIDIDLQGIGTLLPVPALTLSGSSIDFGSIVGAGILEEELTLSSTGNDTLQISSITFDLTAFSTDATTPFELSPGESSVLTITFQPETSGVYSGQMTIHSNSPSTHHIVSLSGEAETEISYASSIQPVLNANCTGCHGSNGGLTLSSYANLMAGTSNNGPVVTAGDGANSLIIKKLRGEVGARMPLGRAALAAATISTIETWIDQGALDN